MRIRWLPAALDDRRTIADHISTDDPGAAIRMDGLFGRTVGRLADLPMLGRPGAVPGTRELIPHASYRIVYEIADETVWILAVVHTARLWPPADDAT